MSGQEQDTSASPPADPQPETVASFRLLVAHRDQLRALAEAEHRTLSQELRRMVEARCAAAEAAA